MEQNTPANARVRYTYLNAGVNTFQGTSRVTGKSPPLSECINFVSRSIYWKAMKLLKPL